jgi:hypothetical protein
MRMLLRRDDRNSWRQAKKISDSFTGFVACEIPRDRQISADRAVGGDELESANVLMHDLAHNSPGTNSVKISKDEFRGCLGSGLTSFGLTAVNLISMSLLRSFLQLR